MIPLNHYRSSIPMKPLTHLKCCLLVVTLIVDHYKHFSIQINLIQKTLKVAILNANQSMCLIYFKYSDKKFCTSSFALRKANPNVHIWKHCGSRELSAKSATHLPTSNLLSHRGFLIHCCLTEWCSSRSIEEWWHWLERAQNPFSL